MKNTLFTLVFISSFNFLFAGEPIKVLKEKNTLTTCFQDIGFKRLSTGIVQKGKTFEMITILTNKKDKTFELIRSEKVVKAKCAKQDCFINKLGTSRLVFFRRGGHKKANLMILNNKGQSLVKTGLYCFDNWFIGSSQ